MNNIIEKLAALAHEQWRGWIKYAFSKCPTFSDWEMKALFNLPGGTFIVIPDIVARWERQFATPYAELLENEKDSYRIEARRVIEALGLRPEVLLFAMEMERKLRANDYKGGWKDESFAVLWERMKEETFELDDAVENDDDILILSEAADVANFAMMIADVKGALK